MQAAAKEQVTPASPQPPGRSAGGASPGGPILAVALALAFVLAEPVAAVAGEAHPGLTGGAPVLARAHDADEGGPGGSSGRGIQDADGIATQGAPRPGAATPRADGATGWRRDAPTGPHKGGSDVGHRHLRGGREGRPAEREGRPAARGPQRRHPPMALSPWELRLLAQMIEAEAGAEPYAGKVAVGAVILNRVRSPLFPDTVEAVIFQPWQFEPILNGWFWREPSPASWRAARDAARGEDPTGGALYFWNPAKSGHQPHLEARPSAGWIGNHRFAY